MGTQGPLPRPIPMSLPCCAHAPYPRVPAVVVVVKQGESSIQETIQGKGRGGHRRLPLSPSQLPARTFFIKLNIGIDLNKPQDLSLPLLYPAMPRAYGGTGREHVACCPTGEPVVEQEGGLQVVGHGHGHGTASARLLKTCSCRAVRYLASRHRAVQYSASARRGLALRPGTICLSLQMPSSLRVCQSTLLHH